MLTQTTTRVLEPGDLPAALEVLERDPVANAFVTSRVQVAGLDPWRLGGEMWGWYSEGELRSLCYAGANIGNGPGWWVVAFTAGLATASFAILWFLMDRLGRFSESITVDRDVASGIRLAAALVAIGLVLARAAAGDWHSTVPHEAIVEGRFGVFSGESIDEAKRAFTAALVSACDADSWLRQHPQVLGFTSCLPKHGGTGAVYVMLRRTMLEGRDE